MVLLSQIMYKKHTFMIYNSALFSEEGFYGPLIPDSVFSLFEKKSLLKHSCKSVLCNYGQQAAENIVHNVCFAHFMYPPGMDFWLKY